MELCRKAGVELKGKDRSLEPHLMKKQPRLLSAQQVEFSWWVPGLLSSVQKLSLGT